MKVKKRGYFKRSWCIVYAFYAWNSCLFENVFFKNGKISPYFMYVFSNFYSFSASFYSFLKKSSSCLYALEYEYLLMDFVFNCTQSIFFCLLMKVLKVFKYVTYKMFWHFKKMTDNSNFVVFFLEENPLFLIKTFFAVCIK